MKFALNSLKAVSWQLKLQNLGWSQVGLFLNLCAFTRIFVKKGIYFVPYAKKLGAP